VLLFHNESGRLLNIGSAAGPVFARAFPARGLAVGDIDNDGRIDVLVSNNGDRPLVLRNHAGAGHHWLDLKLQGVGCNRDAIGARISWAAGGVKRSRLKTGGGSYLSSHDPREVLGLGANARAEWGRFDGCRPAAGSSASPICRQIATSPSSKARGSFNAATTRTNS
jgi:hypothetical protein